MRDGVQLGRKDRLRSVWQETLLWSQLEEANLHILSPKDVLADFLDGLEVGIAVRKKDEEAGSLTEEGKAELAAMVQKQASLTDNAKQREKYTARLVIVCGLRARTCQQTANLSHEEETLRLETAWRLFDQLVSQAASPEVCEALPVADPYEWAVHRSQTAITMSDQAQAQPWASLDQCVEAQGTTKQRKIRRDNRQRRQAAKAKAKVKGRPKAKAKAGPRVASARREHGVAARWRVSLVARQAVTNYFQPDREPQGQTAG